MKNENFSRFCKAGQSETKRAKKESSSLFLFIMQSICHQSLRKRLTRNLRLSGMDWHPLDKSR